MPQERGTAGKAHARDPGWITRQQLAPGTSQEAHPVDQPPTFLWQHQSPGMYQLVMALVLQSRCCRHSHATGSTVTALAPRLQAQDGALALQGQAAHTA